MPKALVPICGKPLLYHLMRYLQLSGVNRFVLCVGHLAEQIERFAHETPEFQGAITCVNSGDVGMTDRILDASRHFQARALICYGDTLANVDIVALQRRHTESDALATITVYPLHSPFGIVEPDEAGRVVAFREKPVLPYWINVGFLLCEREALSYMDTGADLDQFLLRLAAVGRLFSHRHGGKHLTVNTDRDRAFAEAHISQFLTLLEGTGS